MFFFVVLTPKKMRLLPSLKQATLCLKGWHEWETDFYTPPVLRGAALLTLQRQRCFKILSPKDPEFYTSLALNCQKGQQLSALEVYKNQSPNETIREKTKGQQLKGKIVS